MRVIPANIKSEIANGTVSNLIKITRKDSTVFAYTDAEVDLVVDGITYQSAPGLQRLRLDINASAEVSNQEFGSAWVDVPDTDLRGGLFDDSLIEIRWCSWKHPEYGSILIFTGSFSEIIWTDEGYKADIVDYMKNLERIIGNTYTAQCRLQLYSDSKPGVIGRCGVNKTAFTYNSNITAINTPKWKFTISDIKPDGYYSNGLITFTSGLNTGISAEVKTHVGNVIELFLPTAFIITVGTTCSISAGCDKTITTCREKFNNKNNFGGFPHIKPDVTFR